MRYALFTLLVLFMTLLTTPANARPVADGFADEVEKLSPAVVNISTTQTIKTSGLNGNELPSFPPGHPFEEFNEFFKRFAVPESAMKTNSLGSGFVISEDGYIATNNHVVEGAEDITITFSDDTEYAADVVGRDGKTDLAVLKITNAKGKKFPFVKLGDSDKIRVGDWVLAIGNPFGLGGTVTAGIVSARARDINSGPYDDYIQTDAAINRGNSGGPMFNTDGEVVGINTAIFSPSGGSVGIGFAIPSNMAQPIIQQLKAGKIIKRAWLGVKIQSVTKDIAESLKLGEDKGALVADVTPDSPAAKAGVKTGDVITHFAGKEISTMRELPRLVTSHEIGEKTDIRLLRSGKEMTLPVTLGELKEEKPAEKEGDKPAEEEDRFGAEEFLGMSVAPVNGELVKAFKLDKDAKGLVVVKVASDSNASLKGILPGDVITQVNQQAVSSVKEAKKQAEEVKKDGRKAVLLLVARSGNALFMAVPFEKEKKKD